MTENQSVKTPIQVLVLGVGGNVSQGILKSMALSHVPVRVIGACINAYAFGLYTVDKAYVSPLASDPGFMSWLVATCRREAIQLILTGVEPVLDFLSRHAREIHDQCGAIPVVSEPDTLAIGLDKLLTCQWLEKHRFNFPRYAASENHTAVQDLLKQCGFPLLAKPRRGKGAAGIFVVRDDADLDYITKKPGYVVQELLGDDQSEYTAGGFCDRQGRVHGMTVMKRELLSGTTYRAVMDDFPEIEAEAQRIIHQLKPMGPCNIQLRMSHGRPVCFEINMRFSGTNPCRARAGINDAEWSVRHFILNEPVAVSQRPRGLVMLRYWNEMYVEQSAVERLEAAGIADQPSSAKPIIEDYGIPS